MARVRALQQNTAERKHHNNIEGRHGVIKPPDVLPDYLRINGIITLEDWGQMNDEIKVSLLQQHMGVDWAVKLGLEPDVDVLNAVEQPFGENRGIAEVKQATQEELSLQNVRQEFEQIRQVVAVEKDVNQQVVGQDGVGGEDVEPKLSAEEKQRLDVELGKRFTRAVPKFFGYQPSNKFLSGFGNDDLDGEVIEANTWLTQLVKKVAFSMR